MNIADLSHLEHVSESESILGSEGVSGILSLAATVGFPNCLLAGLGADWKSKFKLMTTKSLGTSGVSGVASLIVTVSSGTDPVVYHEGFDQVEVIKATSNEGSPASSNMIAVEARISS